MGKNNTITCDVPDCTQAIEQTPRAGSLEGWIRRDVTDSANKRLAEGMRDTGFRHATIYICPEHSRQSVFPNPELHPDLAEWLDQEETSLDPEGPEPVEPPPPVSAIVPPELPMGELPPEEIPEEPEEDPEEEELRRAEELRLSALSTLPEIPKPTP